MELIIARHGESIGNIVDYDCPDPELTDLGRNQAKLLGKRLAKEKIDFILCSPLIRSLETAHIIANHHDVDIKVYKNLKEVRRLDKFTGLDGSSIQERYPRAILRDKDIRLDKRWEDLGNETEEQAFKRANSMVSYIKKDYADANRILIVAHGAFNSYLISALIGLDLLGKVRFSQYNTCINRFLLENNKCQIISINDYNHLLNLNNGG